MIHLGLIGYPLGHSLSPRLHTAALEACGLEGDYSLFSIAPGDRKALKDLLSRVRSGEIQGLNVTIPHKQTVLEFLDELTPTARAIGAVNTICLKSNKLVGHNTDAPGFLMDMKRLFGDRQSKTLAPDAHLSRAQVPWSAGVVNQKSSLVLGGGGSARAVVYALLNEGWEVTIAARRLEQAEQLAESFVHHQLRITNYQLSNIELSNLSLLVNTTPIGMTPNIDQSPWPENLPFPLHAAIYDLVYNPHETKLVQDARRQGLQATTGLGMLIEQAALSFEIWTGCNPSRETMRTSVQQSPVSHYHLPLTDRGSS
jgi:shikimate dehydrogenase